MTHRSPLVTLAAVAAYFSAMLIANFLVNPHGAVAQSAAPVPQAQPSVTAQESVNPEPSGSTETSAKPAPSASSSDHSADKSADDDAFPHKAVYVGRTENKSLAVAVAVLGDKTVAYVCDGRSREAWLRGSVRGDEVTLSSANGYRIRAELEDHGRLEGTLRQGGHRWDFELKPAKPPAGLYRAKGSKTTIGWIRLPDGSYVGLATDPQGKSSPAPALPADGVVAVDGEQLTATAVDGDTEL